MSSVKSEKMVHIHTKKKVLVSAQTNKREALVVVTIVVTIGFSSAFLPINDIRTVKYLIHPRVL